MGIAVDDFADDWAIEPAHGGALIRLHRALQARSGFSLLLLEYNDPMYRDRLIRRIAPARKSTVIDAAPLADFATFEAELSGAAKDHDVVHVIGLDSWLSGENRAKRLAGVNVHRESIAAGCPAAVLLWLPQDYTRDFALHAADMWEWRSIVLDFTIPRVVEQSLLRPVELGSAERVALQHRLDEIDAFLHQAAESQSPRQRAMLLEEAGEILRVSGQLDQALAALEEAVSLRRVLDDPRGVAIAQGEIAHILTARGQVDDALALHQSRLEVFEQLGDWRSRALALGDIARIYESWGQVDDALDMGALAAARPYFERALAIYEKQLGPEHPDTASSLNNLGTLLYAMGELAAARPYLERALAILEDKLGPEHPNTRTVRGNLQRLPEPS